VSTGLDFTTLARVRALLGFAAGDTTQDTLLQQLIAATSARIEDEMGRLAKKLERTELHSLEEAQHVLALKATPVDTAQAFTIKGNTAPDFASSTALTVNQAYTLKPDSGLVRIFSSYTAPRRSTSNFPAGPIFFQVVYTGGMAADTATFITAYPDIAQATDLQVAYLHKRRTTGAGGNITVGAGSTQFESEYGLLKEVRSLIARHRRVQWV